MATIATDDESVILPSMAENLLVWGGDGQSLTERNNFVSPVPQQEGHFRRHVMVE